MAQKISSSGKSKLFIHQPIMPSERVDRDGRLC